MDEHTNLASEMAPEKPVPYPAGFENAESYVESLFNFMTTSEMLQTLCGGVHILDFLTLEPDLYTTILPAEWRQWLSSFDISDILDLLMRENVDQLLAAVGKSRESDEPADHASTPNHGNSWRGGPHPPLSLLRYISEVRKYTLDRSFHESKEKSSTDKRQPLSRHTAVGMKPKKSHEVENFAAFIDDLTLDISKNTSSHISHLVDFGSGQNYLGRALASPPYEKQVVAVESKHANIMGAKSKDISAKLAEKKKVRRNKKAYRAEINSANCKNFCFPEYLGSPTDILQTSSLLEESISEKQNQLPLIATTHPAESSKNIQYVEHTIKDGDLAAVVSCISQNQIKKEGCTASNTPNDSNNDTLMNREVPVIASKSTAGLDNQLSYIALDTPSLDLRLMVISLHSCGNLVHHGLRSLVLNPSVKAVAMVGCCYNLMTERLGSPTYKLPALRPQHPRLEKTSSACDPHGFPMSERLTTYGHGRNKGIRLNITARMMAVQAPQNWTSKTCEAFFTRHFYRALLQRIFLDRGVVEKPIVVADAVTGGSPRGWSGVGQPIVIGSLRKACYSSFVAYIRGAVEKLRKDELHRVSMQECMVSLTDDDILRYESIYDAKKQELSTVWSLMAFSAGVVESVIIVDRWLYLKEQALVKDCWVQSVFDYSQSPRNLVVVGIKS